MDVICLKFTFELSFDAHIKHPGYQYIYHTCTLEWQIHITTKTSTITYMLSNRYNQYFGTRVKQGNIKGEYMATE